MLDRENTIQELHNGFIKEYSGIMFKELAFVKKINLRGDPNDKKFLSTNEGALQSTLPTKPNTLTYNNNIKTIWLGPNEWLIADYDNNNINDLFLKLQDINNNEESSITDVTENRTIIRISGGKLFKLLSKFLVLDIDKALYNESSVAQTLFIKVSILIVRNHKDNELPEVDIYVNRSQANYIYKLLVDGTKNLDF